MGSVAELRVRGVAGGADQGAAGQGRAAKPPHPPVGRGVGGSRRRHPRVRGADNLPA